MPPPASTSSHNSSEPQEASDTLQIVLPISLLTFGLVTLLVFKAVIHYRQHAKQETSSRATLDADVAVDVSAAVDLPSISEKHSDFEDALPPEAQRRKATSTRERVSLWVSDIAKEPPSLPEVVNSSSMQSGHSTEDACLRFSMPELLHALYSEGNITTSRVRATLAHPLSIAFSTMDVDGLAQSTVCFPRLPLVKDNISDYEPSLSGRNTIPTIPSLESAEPRKHPRLDDIASVDVTKGVESGTMPGSENPSGEDSLETLVESVPQSTMDMDASLSMILCAKLLLKKLVTPGSGSPGSLDLSSDSDVIVHLNTMTEPVPCLPHTLNGTPDSSPAHALTSLFSPLVSTSLSPLKGDSSPNGWTLAITRESSKIPDSLVSTLFVEGADVYRFSFAAMRYA